MNMIPRLVPLLMLLTFASAPAPATAGGPREPPSGVGVHVRGQWNRDPIPKAPSPIGAKDFAPRSPYVETLAVHRPLSHRELLRSQHIPEKYLKYGGDKVEVQRHLSERHYVEYRNLLREILVKYPPEKHVFLFPGRSLPALFAGMKVLNPNMAVSVPASGLSGDMSPHEKQIIMHELERRLPASELDGRTIVIVDYAWVGGTLRNLHGMVAQHAASGHGGTARVRVLALVNDPAMSTAAHGNVLSHGNGETFDHIDLRRYPQLRHDAHAEAFHDIAPVPRFRPGKDEPPGVTERAEYVPFHAAMRARMQRDEELHRWLSSPRSE
jgi:hypothetical protein